MPPPKDDEKNDDTVDKREKRRDGIISISLDARSRVSYSNGQHNASNCGSDSSNSRAVSCSTANPSRPSHRR